jgi:hypothetical protein
MLEACCDGSASPSIQPQKAAISGRIREPRAVTIQ